MVSITVPYNHADIFVCCHYIIFLEKNTIMYDFYNKKISVVLSKIIIPP